LSLRAVTSGIVLTVVLSVSIIATANWWLSTVDSTSEFFVGVEFAYSDNIDDLENLVDRVKDYTNLFVMGALEFSFNQTMLNKACNYIVNAGLHLIVLFTDSTKYDYSIFEWMNTAKQQYGKKFLGVYRFDEPGGNQLDNGSSVLVENATSYNDAAFQYTDSLKIIMNYYLNYTPKIFTADYGLYWFDYNSNYSTVFVEFGWNHSRPLHIALCRGAAKAYNRDWGTIVTWEYTDEPYLESGDELYDDLVLAYDNGAKYAVVFSYPKIGPYGILAEDHFRAFEDFWSYVHSNPQEHGVVQGEAVYVLPKDYGFGFRNPSDKIWGLWEADDLSQKVWDDVNTLLEQYGSSLDIVYDEPEFMETVKNQYEKVFFWNETIT
jgi:hypothetical protein